MQDFVLSQAIADMRRDYRLAALEEDTAGDDPVLFFRQWLGEAERAGLDEINAFTLATTSSNGAPHARVVLLKGLDETGFVFFTNYHSDKGAQLNFNPRAAAVFFWKELERQVRIEGFAERVSEEESDAYFASRPIGSRIGAWASAQSQQIESREELEAAYVRYEARFGEGAVPRPAFWGGYRILPRCIEFWQGRSNRLHDRIVFLKKETGGWSKERLQP